MRNRKIKKRAFFVPFILSEGTFLNIYSISMYSVLNTLSENTCFYISTILRHRLFLLVFKIVESLQCNLKRPSIIRTADSVTDFYLQVVQKFRFFCRSVLNIKITSKSKSEPLCLCFCRLV